MDSKEFESSMGYEEPMEYEYYNMEEEGRETASRSRQSEGDQAKAHAHGLTKAKDGDKLNVTMVTNNKGWKITVTGQLLTELAKHPLVRLSGLVADEIPELKAWAKNLDINFVLSKEEKKLAGYPDEDHLAYPPDDLDIDVLIIHSYGIELGRQAQLIKDSKDCKWLHVVHTNEEELAKYGEKEIHEKQYQVQLKLCRLADMIIAIGSKLGDAYRNYLASTGKHVWDFFPGIADDLINVRRPGSARVQLFTIMVSATYYEKYFEAKGLDTAVQAINLLKDTSYHILFLVGPGERTSALEEYLKDNLDHQSQFTVRQFDKKTENLKSLVCEVQLAILPSRAEGFGTSILPALSADVPILVSGNTGLGMALEKLPSGKKHVVDPEKPQVWADKIKKVREKGTENCSNDAQQLREEYMKKYDKQEQCHNLVKEMLKMFPDKQGRLRNSAEHVEDVDTTRASSSGFQQSFQYPGARE
ncbi:PREDICTED: uncharacterized protein LOC107343730 isoform X3 [Acropora digitifera]|uniref:uncharacterized protein LOC107343730 isoform X3 n=1 Tax=Acropora digitifera TaxID=70779 RepID=UPI00077B0D05|nr:PREDICTED: uncharacterized protein LOC107343730 isoform X3 [Acropora digitifera]